MTFDPVGSDGWVDKVDAEGLGPAVLCLSILAGSVDSGSIKSSWFMSEFDQMM